MESFLIEALKTNSPSFIFCAMMFALLYTIIKGQREKTSVKRDNDKVNLEIKIALLEKDVTNLAGQVEYLSSRWDSLQKILSSINENIAAIRATISGLSDRIDRLEETTRIVKNK